MNPFRLDLAMKMGATVALNVKGGTLAEVQKRLGMTEGFDVGLEMSGNAQALRDMIANMCHGAHIAMLGIPDKEMSIDWRTVVFNMLTIKGIYGREMYETWYKMTVMLQSGLEHWSCDHAPLPLHGFRARIRCDDGRRCREGRVELRVKIYCRRMHAINADKTFEGPPKNLSRQAQRHMVSPMQISGLSSPTFRKVPRIPEIVNRPSDSERRLLDYTLTWLVERCRVRSKTRSD
jgi:hypothetical protein